MKTLSVDEASSNLARWLQLALAGEEIGIRTGGAIVALRPAGLLTETEAQPAPREALRLLQRDARLTVSAAEDYLRELREERLADDDRRPE